MINPLLRREANSALRITHCSEGRAQSPSAPTGIYAFGMVALGDRDLPIAHHSTNDVQIKLMH